MNTVKQPMYEWKNIPWKKIERNVFKLQTRIYRAELRGDVKTVHKLQRLLTKSRSAKFLAVRQVTQDNHGKKTAGVDGVKQLTPSQRLEMANQLELTDTANPVRRVWIPKPGSEEKRPLGIPTIQDRAIQSLVKMTLEPQWEAKFEPNSYGFRPGRSGQDAIGAIFSNIAHKPKWVLDADIAKCFDRINHQQLLRKIKASPRITRQIKCWLKAEISDETKLFPSEQGTPQGGVISPVLANIALHGMEQVIQEHFPKKNCPRLIRYADDFVVLHHTREGVEKCQNIISEWLKKMGLELKPSKTQITHTLKNPDGKAGFDFLGFHVQQFPVGKNRSGKDHLGNTLGFKTISSPNDKSQKKQRLHLKETIKKLKSARQEVLIGELRPIIQGWSNYFSAVCSTQAYTDLDTYLLRQLFNWAKSRHSRKSNKWIYKRYWKKTTKVVFAINTGQIALRKHIDTRIKRHIKVKGQASPFDGNWVYWSTRLGELPTMTKRKAILLKRQGGRCLLCGLFFKDGDLLEVDHLIPKEQGGRDAYYNWQLVHRHCHHRKTANDAERYA